MTKEEILEKRRNIIGNQLMPVLSDTIYNMMDEYAKQQAIAFHKALYPTSPDFDAHISARYERFIEQQTKDK